MKAIFIKTKIKNIINITKIVTIHYFEFDKQFVFKGEKHDFWEMVYIDKGEVAIKADNDEYILKQGEIIFHKPNEFHSIKAHNSAPNVFVISFVCSSVAMQYFKNYKIEIKKNLKDYISNIINETLNTYDVPINNINYTKLILKTSAQIGGEQLIKTNLEQLFIMLIRNKVDKNDTTFFLSKQGMENHIVDTINSIIKENICEKLLIGDICRLIGYSKTYSSKIFKQYTSYSIGEYFIIKKIEQAKLYIRENNLNFTQISDKLKFDNPQYFSRTFKRVTKMSPSEYKISVKQ